MNKKSVWMRLNASHASSAAFNLFRFSKPLPENVNFFNYKKHLSIYKWIKVSDIKDSRNSVKIYHPFRSYRCTKWTRCDVFMIRTRCHGNSTPERVGHAIYPTYAIKGGAVHPGLCPQPMSRPTDSRLWAKVLKP